MADNPYEEKFQAAELIFDDDSEECVRLAKLNLSEPGLPVYYDIQSRILISTASEFWNDAHDWRQDAHQEHRTFHAKALRERDTAALESLRYVSEQSKHLDDIPVEYLTQIVDKERENMTHAPPEERLRIFYDIAASEVSNDEGEAEDEPVVKSEQNEFVLSFRGGLSRGGSSHGGQPRRAPSRAAPSRATSTPNPKVAATTTALDVTKTSAPGFLRGTASSVAKKRGTPTEFPDDTPVQEKQSKEDSLHHELKAL